jgi:hypothetical protein
MSMVVLYLGMCGGGWGVQQEGESVKKNLHNSFIIVRFNLE